MFDLVGLAFRNTRRNTRRSILTLLSIAIGSASLLCFAGFIEFSFYGLRETTIRNELGHMQIYKKGYAEKRLTDPESVQIENSEEIIKALSEIKGISTVTGRLNFAGLGGAGNASQTVSVIGLNPARELEFGAFERVREGRQLIPSDKDQGVVGSELLKGLDAEVGDWVTVLTNTLDGVFNAVDFQIVGVVSTGSTAYDAVFVKIPIELAQRALNTDSVEYIIVLLKNTEDLPELKGEILSKLGEMDIEFETKTWDQLAGFYQSVVNLYTGQFRVFSIIIGIVLLFSVLNTMTMAVLERTPEISALRAIGAKRQDVVKLILIEGTILGLLGGVIGIVLSFVISGVILLSGGITMPPPPGSSMGYQALLLITAKDAAIVFVISVAAAFVSSLFPAMRAQKLKISEGLRA